jgi:hypothetical protein
LTRIITEPRPVLGYGLTIWNDGEREQCGFLDGSPVLTPSAVEPGERRRLRFNEGPRQIRAVGDIFCPDIEVACLAREAINEKLQRDRDEDNAFFVADASVSRRVRYLFVRVTIQNRKSGERERIAFTVEAPRAELQEEGQQEFMHFIDALGVSVPEDVERLRGCTATFEWRNGSRIFKRWPTA